MQWLSSVDSSYLYTCIFGICVSVIFLFAFWMRWKQKRDEAKYREAVSQFSKRYSAIWSLNKKYSFHSIDPSIYTHCNLSNKRQYDRFDFDSYFDEYVASNLNMLRRIDRHLEENRLRKIAYDSECGSLPPFLDESTVQELGFDYTRFHEKEVIMVEDSYISPNLETKIHCYKEYISPQGRNRYSDCKVYPFSDYKKALDYIAKKQRYRSEAEAERKKMTESMRYDVMKRDCFRCVLCGKMASDGVTKLHVDHILPVTKGGKTEMHNLRTLCENCNRGKSNKYDYFGVN